MEVHPPEHGIHSWKDFFIHMGTIVLGLLIAVGLEQSVEAFHRSHQRHELRERLQEEVEGNLEAVDLDFQYTDAYQSWLASLMQSADAARASKGKLHPTFQPPPTHYPQHPEVPLFPMIPASSVWNAAKQNTTTSLLPPKEQESYTFLYWDQSQTMGRWETFDQGLSTLYSFLYRFAPPADLRHPDLSHMTDVELAEYRALLAKQFAAARDFRRALLFYGAVSEDVHNGREIASTDTMAKLHREHSEKFPGLEDVSSDLNPAEPAK